jgi:hypothetical protein
MESYKPKNDPERTAWCLPAESFDFCDKKTNSDGSGASVAQPDIGPLQEEDVPF